ncbi:MAG: hypothetical protein KGO02_21950 [Alphaproteobacteria bacterium]|nr:hypothetical protein [Alphaproteobacteria bacterium]
MTIGKNESFFFHNKLGTGNTRTASAYWVGHALVIPVDVGSTGNECLGGGIEFISLHKGRRPILSPMYGHSCSAGVSVKIKDGALIAEATSSVTSGRLEVTTYRYENGRCVRVSAKTPVPPPGYLPLITPHLPLKTMFTDGQLSLRIGVKLSDFGRIFLNRVRQHLPWNTLLYAPDGVVPIAFHRQGKTILIIEDLPDEADGPKLQIMEIGKKHITYSRLFGIHGAIFNEVYYKEHAGTFYFDFLEYRQNTLKAGQTEDQTDGPFEIVPITYNVISSRVITEGGTGSVMGARFLPARSRIATRNPLPRWFELTNDESCIPAEPRDPAALVRYDMMVNNLADNVNIFERRNGVPIGVKVAKPGSNGMETVYTYFRTKAACTAYVDKNKSLLKSIQ